MVTCVYSKHVGMPSSFNRSSGNNGRCPKISVERKMVGPGKVRKLLSGERFH